MRTVEVGGMWLPDPASDSSCAPLQVWVPDQVLEDVDRAREDNRWVQTDTMSQEDALIAAGFAIRDRNTEFVQGTPALTAALHPPADDRGFEDYDPARHGPWYAGDPGIEQMSEAALAEGFQRCASCETLPVSFFRDRYDDHALRIAYSNALHLKLSGGYGMFFDRPAIEVVLCHDCAHQLVAQQPFLETLIQPARSHSHPQRYTDAHPEHTTPTPAPAPTLT